jgi:hypothetical protein
LSFFDEADEPPVAPRSTARSRRSTGGGRRPPGDQQSIQVRRLIAAGAILVVLILIIVGIHSCQVSSRNSGLRDYSNNVSSLIQQSNSTSSQLFSQLSSAGHGAANANSLTNQVNQEGVAANSQLNKAKGLSVPDEMQRAQQYVVLALQMRRDGIYDISSQIAPALGKATPTDALNAIAADMASFYASDVVYKNYATKQIASALHGAGIAVGGTDGVQIEDGQFLPDIQWLTPSFIAGKIGSTAPATPNGKPAPGLHGHSLDSVTVGGNQLQSGSTNTISRSPAPTFTLNLTNGGTNNEQNVVCKVNVSGAGISGQTTVPQTTAGQATTCSVQLSAAPPAGSYTVTATVQPVPGEKNTANNTLSFPVTFQ